MARSPCVLCGEKAELSFQKRADMGDSHHFVTCNGCGLTWLDPLPEPGDRLDDYEAGDFTAATPAWLLEDKLQRALRPSAKGRAILGIVEDRAGPRWNPTTVVDVGCSWGNFVGALSEAYPSATVTGVEPDMAIVDAIRPLALGSNVKIQLGDLERATRDPGSLDLLSMLTVLEHLPNPRESLAQVHSSLHPDGLLVITVPNLLDPGTLFGPRRFFSPAHVYYYTESTLAALLRSEGFDVIDTMAGEPFEISTGELVFAVARRQNQRVPCTGLSGEADRVVAAIKAARRQTRISAPIRRTWRYRIRRPTMRAGARVRDRLLRT